MGELKGTSAANIVIHQRQSFQLELGIPSVLNGAILNKPSRIAVGDDRNLFFTTPDGELVELKPFDTSILDGLFPAVYFPPAAVLSVIEAAPGLVGEVGGTYNASFNFGFDQKDAGDPYYLYLLKDNNILFESDYVNPPPFGVTSQYSLQGENFKLRVSYQEGEIKYNALGNASPSGRIQPGTIDSGVISIKGFYNSWYGSVTIEPISSDAVRSLSAKLGNNLDKFIIEASTLMQVLVVAPGMELVSVIDLDALNVDLTSQYELKGSMTINSPSSAPIAGYKKFIRTQGVAYAKPHRHQVTLKRI